MSRDDAGHGVTRRTFLGSVGAGTVGTALGLRMTEAPLTPQRVLERLAAGRARR